MTLRPQHRFADRLVADLAAIAAAFDFHPSPSRIQRGSIREWIVGAIISPRPTAGRDIWAAIRNRAYDGGGVQAAVELGQIIGRL